MKKVGRYEIVEELGRGATGVVYKASDPTIGRVVALKVLSLTPTTAEGLPGAREIFMREARAAGSLSHPGIVAIHDALEDPETQSSCIVMEYVPGRTLEKVLASKPRVETERALEISRQVAEALDYAHRQKVVHRDLKPANIILTDDGQAKLTDFGIAKIVAGQGALRTVSIMGTPSYMSPEQVSGGEVDIRSDLFSLGIVLYAMLTGEKPFKGETATVMFKIAYEDAAQPSQLNAKLSPAHDYLVLRCLAKNRDKRYSSAREFLDDLEDVQQGRPPRSEAKVPLSELRIGELTVITNAPPASLQPRATRKTAWLSAGMGAGLLLLVSLVGFWVPRHRNGPAKPPAAAPIIPAPGAPNASASAELPPSLPPSPSPNAPLPEKQLVRGEKLPPPARSKPAKSSADMGKKPEMPPARQRIVASSSPATSTPATPPISAPTAATNSARAVQLICQHDLANATLTVSSSNQIISQWSLKGKKRGGLLGIKGSHRGTFSRPITIPEGARELSVRVVSADGAFDLSRLISATPPAGSSPTLRVDVSGDQLTVNWQTPARPKT